MSIARITEIKSSSPVSFDDAIKKGIARANKTLKNVTGAWIWNQEVLIDKKGEISEYRVQMKITFVLEE
jgi:dodecin